jgi:hypothetical protein
MTPPWTVRTVRERAELAQIVELQRANLAVNLSAEEASAQGFVTAVHDLETLQQMHDLAPSIVAQTDTALAGYALTMLIEARAYVPILEPMFALLETLSWALAARDALLRDGPGVRRPGVPRPGCLRCAVPRAS